MLKSLAKALVGTVLLPADAVADVVTLGGVNTGRDRMYTSDRLRDIGRNLKNATTPEKRDDG